MLHIAKYNAEVRERFASREKSKVTGVISNVAAISVENKVNQRLPEKFLHWFSDLLEQFTELRKTLYLLLPVSYNGYK